VAWNCVAPAVVTFGAACEPNATTTEGSKFSPFNVIAVPPAEAPSDGCATGGKAKVGAADGKFVGAAASTKLTPRLAMLKRSWVSSASSISDGTP